MTTIVKKYTALFTGLLFVVVLFNACHKKDSLGKSICPSDFKITTPFTLSLSSVDPATDTLNIVAGFSEEIEWWIHIKGNTSGATKNYHGKSDSLNIDFYGNSETDIFFKDENCEVKLELGCGHDGATKSFAFAATPTVHNTNFGVLLTDFDNTTTYTTGGGWYDLATKEVEKRDNFDEDPSPQGGEAMLYYGRAIDSTSLLWYYGGFSSSIKPAITTLVNSGVTDPERIYLNMYVRGYADFPNTQLQLSLEGLKDTLDAGKVVPESKNYSLSIDWDGWKMVSIKFSEFVNLHDFQSTKISNNNEITNLGMGLGAGPEQNSAAKLLLDFIFITVDKPYREVDKRNY